MAEMIRGLFDVKSESEGSELMIQLTQLSPDPDISDYIFWSDEFVKADGTIDTDGIIGKCFKYKPITL